ncbi:MAG: PLDc N-terminal domain-containing protein [Bacilli bacterium]|nr:PLDc N-terminal domain-containing protein [Bacilli bacterium]
MEEILNLLPLLLPIVLIDFILRIYCVIDIFKVDRVVKGGNKIIWALVCGLINFGWVVYLIIGKDE